MDVSRRSERIVSNANRFASKTLAGLVELLLERRESIARCVDALRDEAVDALTNRDRSDVFDHEDPSADSDADGVLMLMQRAERRLWDVEQALARVENGTFGCCAGCGGEIPIERLRALPATAHCVACSHQSARHTRRTQGFHGPADMGEAHPAPAPRSRSETRIER